MPNTHASAKFAERRSHVYHGKVVDQQTHMGYDLASTSHAPVPAANDGVVVFAGPLGIYGNAVILDHGLGLFSL
jgi:murein DD-endopeptidase MepM/ murein hydrolase activator NlpD